ncbi:MAG: DTW domain-containing protein [Treponema sp.]|nr:DTW domain-containing protein [Treponema sp.]
MSERCFKCFKPQSVCLCKYTKELDTKIKFVFLMHPKEFRKQRTGTGNLAHICLKDSEIIVGLDFEENARFQELMHSDKYFPVLMYPGEDAWTAKKEGFAQLVGDKTLLVIILDATWFCSKKMIEHNQFLLKLPRVSFAGSYTSIFTFKREPYPDYISTIECCYYFIKELQTINFVDPAIDPEPLINVFKQMIKLQLQCENDRIAGILPDVHSYDAKYKKAKEIPSFILESKA